LTTRNKAYADPESGTITSPMASPAYLGDVDAADRSTYGRTIQSVDRALMLIEQVAASPDGLTLSEMAEQSCLNASTCHHLVSTLAGRGFLTRLDRRRGYVLGPKIRELHEMAEREHDAATLIRDDLAALGQRLGRGVQFAVLSECSLITQLSFPDPKRRVVEPDEIEKMTALHATATGKSILAWIPDTELVRVISANGLTRYTARTMTTLSGVVEELRLVRRRKYAIDDEEFREGIVCVGSTLREVGGAVVGSISVTLPAEDADAETRKSLIKSMITAANDFSTKLRSARR
jgi:IclR family transcriptional regulator, acetate operon repressor